MFKELEKDKNSVVEEKRMKHFLDAKIMDKSIEQGKDYFVFYDGPIYANAKPGIHHVFAKTIKDAFCKYKSMQGYKVLRKIGLDTHGLPIEVNVEKKLGFNGKKDIEEFGIENFCKECNKNTALNIDEVNHVTNMMGQFIDCDNPYVTCSNEFIESEWWIIKEMFKKDLIYHGNKILWYCPRCGTELSSFEVAQGYQQDPVNSIILPFKKKDEDVYFLVWTTTPWTLMANVALCVNPDLTYVKVESMGYKFILCESLVNKVLGDEVTVLETYKGKDLVGSKYEQFLEFVNVEGKAFEVLADNYVTDTDGTGIVHIAPAYGADDNRVASENGIAFINPVGPDGCYTEGPWKGRLVTDPELEIEIIKYLKENDKLFKKIKLTHDYPHCWRCKSALISYPKPAWYVATTKYKDKIIEANSKINWYPDYIGEKRFANWLDNMVDWGISRSRYWGCPLPIWTNSETGELYCVGSREELQELAIEDVDVMNMELHRPYIDNIHIKSPTTGDTLTRVEDVLDVWFDSGSMPYAQYHYPFENKELFESQFPADFIAEGVDQTRGWFYVLLVISTIISGESSFKNVVVNDMMLDAHGKKMSKSTGNIVDPIETMEVYGADATRFYMLNASPVWTPLKFDIEGVKEVQSKFFNTLKNTYTFFQMYANTDSVDPRTYEVDKKDLEEIDLWLLSKYNRLVKDVTMAMDEYDLNKVCKYLNLFVNDDLSNWYIRRNRRRFWGSELDNSKKAVYKTTFNVLEGLCRLMAPIVPFISDEIYTNLTGEESVHLAKYPVCDESMINETIETRMDLIRDLITLGRNAREEANIKVRQPISEVILDGKNESILSDLVDLIKEELNVKEVVFAKDLGEFMNFSVKPNFKVCGKLLGANIKEFQTKLEGLSEDEISKLEKGNNITLNINNEDLEVTPEMVEIRVSSKEGFNASHEGSNFIVLNTQLTDDLINEGIVREFISKVQNLRKTKDFEITDRINIYYVKNDDFTNAIANYLELIKDETLAIEIEEKDVDTDSVNLNGIDVKFDVERRQK